MVNLIHKGRQLQKLAEASKVPNENPSTIHAGLKLKAKNPQAPFTANQVAKLLDRSKDVKLHTLNDGAFRLEAGKFGTRNHVTARFDPDIDGKASLKLTRVANNGKQVLAQFTVKLDSNKPEEIKADSIAEKIYDAMQAPEELEEAPILKFPRPALEEFHRRAA